MLILGIDTSGKTASCAVLKDDTLLACKTVFTKLTHSQVILPFVQEILSDCGLTIDDVDLVAAADGPGSYTGLRIGISMVKGLCFGGKKCLGVSTLEGLAANCLSATARIFAIMAARPGIVYFGAYDSDGERLNCAVADCVIGVERLRDYADSYSGDIILTGDAAKAVKAELFSDDEKVRLSPAAQRLQLASGICTVAAQHPERAGTAEQLNARYLQITKAEKDLKEKAQG